MTIHADSQSKVRLPGAVILLLIVFHLAVSDSASALQERKAPKKPKREEILKAIETITAGQYVGPDDKFKLQRLLDGAAKLYPNDPEFAYWRGDLLERKTFDDPRPDLGPARKIWEEKVIPAARAGTDPKLKVLGARCLVRIGGWDLSKRAYSDAYDRAMESIKLAPMSVEGYVLLSGAGIQARKIEEVKQTLSQASDTYSATNPEMRSTYWNFLAQIGDIAGLQEVTEKSKLPMLHPDIQHFRGLIAEADGKIEEAFIHHVWAVEAGIMYSSITRRSQAYISRFTDVPSTKNSPRLAAWITAVKANGEAQAKAASEQLKLLKPQIPEEAALLQHYLAKNFYVMRQEKVALALWQGMLKHDLVAAPIMIGAGECLEAIGEMKEAEALFAQAKARFPQNKYVRNIFRLGASFRLHGDNVEVVKVDAESPLAQIGIMAGDVILKLDSDVLSAMKPRDRLTAVRLYLGGKILFRTKDDQEIVGNMEITPP